MQRGDSASVNRPALVLAVSTGRRGRSILSPFM